MNYINENDQFAVAWLKELMRDGLIPPAYIDPRSICDVKASELEGYTQCHFFGGIAGWCEALRLAGFPAGRSVWSGSCPCQPYSCAGKGKGDADPRNLWPQMFRLVSECRPEFIFGEQVENAIGHGWLDGISADLEGKGYAVGSIVLGAHSAGAPHIRHRLFWGACRLSHTSHNGQPRLEIAAESTGRNGVALNGGTGQTSKFGWIRVSFAADCGGGDENELGDECSICGLDYTDCGCPGPTQDGYEYEERNGVLFGRLVKHIQPRLERYAGHGYDGNQSGWIGAKAAGSTAKTSWLDSYPVRCLDGKTRRIPTQSEIFPLASRLPNRVGLLRGAGNSIVPQVAAEFIRAFMEAEVSPA